MRLVKLIIIAVILSLGLWWGIYGNSASEGKDMSYGLSIMTDKTNYSVGDTITITLKVFNYTEEALAFYFNTSQRYDFIIEDEEGNEIWRWSEGKMFAMVLGEETLGPLNPAVIYAAEYRNKLSSGYYKVTGVFITREKPMSGSIIIEVK